MKKSTSIALIVTGLIGTIVLISLYKLEKPVLIGAFLLLEIIGVTGILTIQKKETGKFLKASQALSLISILLIVFIYLLL